MSLAVPLSQPPHAVIDIGSNSVRLVVYHALTRVPMPLFNEKYYCALADGLAETGKLNPKGMQHTRAALARFVIMLQRFNVESAEVIATAAVRDATDGAAFVAQLEEEFGLPVQIIDGKQEAALAASGVLASFYRPKGVVADLGGGSLELAALDQQRVQTTTSLPLGTLRLHDRKLSETKLTQHCDAVIQQVAWLKSCPSDRLYAIGGSFRAIAKCYMRQHHYPLNILHGLTLKRDEAQKITRQLIATPVNLLADLPGIPSRRAHTMPIAAQILDRLMTRLTPKTVTFSVSGIREGLLFSALDKATRQQDPLIASANDLSHLAGRKGRYAEEIYHWMQPLFTHAPESFARLLQAFCRLSEIAWTIDPNFRAEWSYLRILQSDMKGLTHAQRVMLALAMYHRHQIKSKREFGELVLLSPAERLWAQCAGVAANLAFQLSGGQAGFLHHTTLRVDHQRIQLETDAVAKPLRTEMVEKRLEGLGFCFSAFSSLSK